MVRSERWENGLAIHMEEEMKKWERVMVGRTVET